MADTKTPDYDLPADLTFPVALVDPLSVIQEAERGNTPRPSRARLAFVSGVSAIQKKQFESAFKQVRIHRTARYHLFITRRDLATFINFFSFFRFPASFSPYGAKPLRS